LPETAMEPQANTYFVFVLMNKTITVRNFHTQYALLNVSNAAEPGYVNQVNASFFKRPSLINLFGKTIKTENELGIIKILCS
jgi:hypothetical protein